jgi:peptide/nickel transport system ATP-binding protein
MEVPILSVQDLSVGFSSRQGTQTVVHHISFNVYADKTLAIVGESGSGKSVSSLSIMQLLQKGKAFFESGKFVIDAAALALPGESDVAIAPDDELLASLRGKSVSMIFQEPMTSLNPVMQCGEQVSEMLRKHTGLNKEQAKQKTIALFEEVKLPRAAEMFDQYPHQLSGGQRQRVMIAMAISCNPKILIADEPTTALDVTVQKEILQLLKSLQLSHGMGIIFITHDLGVVAEIADEILVMKRGQVVEHGQATRILSQPQHPYTQGLLACRPALGKKVERLQTVEDFLNKDKLEEPKATIKRAIEPFGDVLLSVRNATKTYKTDGGLFNKKSNDVKAVNDVSFEIKKGETLGLVGESGCGKTTLSRMLLGLIPATSGQIIFNGKDITTLDKAGLKAMRKEMQIIFQDPYSSLNPKHTIGESITEPMMVLGLHGTAQNRRAKAIDLLSKVGLGEEHFARYPHEFSGGQRQRVVIARALACEPSFIICDESVSALDVSVQAQVLNLLNELKQDFQLTYLFISHDLGVVYHMSDRIMVMNKGVVEEIGTCDEVFFHPKSAYTQRLLNAIPGRHSV